MQIVKKDSFRSYGTLVNKSDDMYRVIVDMKKTEYPEFAKLVEEKSTSTNNAMVPCPLYVSDGIKCNIGFDRKCSVKPCRLAQHQ